MSNNKQQPKEIIQLDKGVGCKLDPYCTKASQRDW